MLKDLFIASAALLTVSGSGIQRPDPLIVSYSEEITAADLNKHLTVLASDGYEGRETGKEGQKKAAAYISSEFRKAGIPPLFNLSYYQQFSLVVQYPNKVSINSGGTELQNMKDFYFFPGMNEEKIEAKEVLFLGYGIADERYDDYKGKEASNKVVMVLDGEPIDNEGFSLVTGNKELSEWGGYWRKKPEFADSRNVKALLIVVNDVEKNVKENSHFIEGQHMRLAGGKEKQHNRPVFYVSRAFAEGLLKKGGAKSIAQAEQDIRKKKKPVSALFKAAISINIVEHSEEASSENVLGYIEGSDLKEQVIIVSAHYDHLGKKGDVVFNGADDDGSGTVALIEMAKAFAKAKAEGKGPRRSILFLAVAGEEKGLLGSRYYTQNPVFALANTVADLNIDMIGRVDEKHTGKGEYIYVIGADRHSTELHAINEAANKTYTKMELDYTYNDPNDKNRYFYRSDHYNFAKNNIPVIFYFNGTHPDYHKETDEISKIDFSLMEKRTRLVFCTAWELANRTERIKLDVKQ